MKSIMVTCTRVILTSFNLSHMDPLGGPAATHRSKTIYQKPTQAARPNELIDPEISMKNKHILTYSVLGSGPAIFPASIIFSHACIVFLSAASSSSHVILQLGARPLVEGGGAKIILSRVYMGKYYRNHQKK